MELTPRWHRKGAAPVLEPSIRQLRGRVTYDPGLKFGPGQGGDRGPDAGRECSPIQAMMGANEPRSSCSTGGDTATGGSRDRLENRLKLLPMIGAKLFSQRMPNTCLPQSTWRRCPARPAPSAKRYRPTNNIGAVSNFTRDGYRLSQIPSSW